LSYAKLLKRVDPRSRSPFEWQGKFLRPGSTIPESALWPDGSYPRVPLIVEFAGAEHPARGWRRHECDETVILWRYERAQSQFAEVGRVLAPGAMWMRLLEPLVLDAMRSEFSGVPPPDFERIRERISRTIAAELDLIRDEDRARVLTAVHDELAGMIAEWSVDPVARGAGEWVRPSRSN
jgi:hypothetical protein